MPGLSPGVTQTNTISFTAPSVSGTYYLWLCFEAQYSMQDAVNQRTQSMSGLPGHVKIVVTSSTSPVGYWKFDEGSGNIAHDSSGNGNDGIIHTATWTTGIVGDALHFNGVDSWVEIPSSPALTGLSQITLEAWIEQDSLSTDLKGIISKCDGWFPPTNAEYFLGVNDNGRVLFDIDNGVSIAGSNPPTHYITEAGTWYHVAGTWSGSDYAIYVNGVEVFSGTCTPQTTRSNTLPVQIGRHGSWPWVYFNGIIDEVKIYNYARTAEEIQSDAQSLVIAWKDATSFGLENSHLKLEGVYSHYTHGVPWFSDLVFKDTGTVWTDPWQDILNLYTILVSNFVDPSSVTIEAFNYGDSAELTYSCNIIRPYTYISVHCDLTFTITQDSYIHWTATVASIDSYTGQVPIDLQLYTFIAGDTANDFYYVPGHGQGQFIGTQQNINYVPSESWTAVWDQAKQEGCGIVTTKGFSNLNVEISDWYALTAVPEMVSFQEGPDSLITLAPGEKSQVHDEYLYFFTGTGWQKTKDFYDSVPPSPVGYWKFDEGSGTVASDSSGNGNTGTLLNGPQWVAGISGTALSFDGYSSNVVVPDSSSLTVSGNQLSVEMWLKPTLTLDSTAPINVPLDKGNEYCFQMSIDGHANLTPDGKYWFAVVLEPSIYNWQGIETTTNRWVAGQWYHLAGTYDGNYLKVYVNGVLENSRALSGNLIAQGGGGHPLSFGYTKYIGGDYFNGAMDEVKIYNYARTADEIRADASPVRAWKDDSSLGLENDRLYLHGLAVTGNELWFFDYLVFKDTGTTWYQPWGELAIIVYPLYLWRWTTFTSYEIHAFTESDKAYLTYSIVKDNLKEDITYTIYPDKPYINITCSLTNVGTTTLSTYAGAQFTTWIAGDYANDYYYVPGHGQGQFTGGSNDMQYPDANETWVAEWDQNKGEGAGMLSTRGFASSNVMSIDWGDSTGEGFRYTSDNFNLTPGQSSITYDCYLYFFTGVGWQKTKSFFDSLSGSPPLTTSISPLSASINIGQSVTFDSAATGGTPPYDYQWYLNGTSASDATQSVWTFTPTATGTYDVYLNVTDASNSTAQSEIAEVTVTVPAYPSMYFTPSPVVFTTSNATIGTLFNLTLWLNMTGTSDLVHCWNVDLSYNATQLEFLNAWLTNVSTSDFFSGHATYFFNYTWMDGDNGTVALGETLFDSDSVTGVYGSLCFLEFKVLLTNQDQTSAFNITFGLTGSWSGVFDTDYNEIPVSFIDDTYNFVYVGVRSYDLNNDSRVDITDVAIVSIAFGSSPIRPRWNANADLNQDGRVDITDVALVAKHFGQHYP
jgi:hypothetical protein